MKKYILLFLIFFITAIVLSQNKEMFSYLPFKSAEWTSKITIESTAGKQVINQKTFYKAGKMRIEGKDTFGNEYITIIDKNYVYVINPNQKSGMKYPVESKQNPEKNNLELEKCRKSAKKSGTEKINGIECEIIEFDCIIDKIKFSIKEWKGIKDNFVLKSITKIEGASTITEILDLKKDIKISDNKFVPDKDIKFMDMQTILGEKSSKKNSMPDEEAIKTLMKKTMENSSDK